METLRVLASRVQSLIFATAPKRQGVVCIQGGNRLLSDMKKVAKSPDALISYNEFRNLPLVDVGYHAGEFTMLYSRYLKPEHIFAFDPLPLGRKVIGSTVTTLKYVALSSRVSDRLFYCQGKMSRLDLVNAHMNIEKPSADMSQVNVRTSTLDIELDHTKTYGLLKIDTEGHDLEVLKGAHSLLSRRAFVFILFEFYRFGSEGGGLSSEPSFQEYLKLLSSYSYRPVGIYTDWISSNNAYGVYNGLFVRDLNLGRSVLHLN